MTPDRDTKIYTKKGDTGETGLGDNRRVSKSSPRIETLGALDELNSHLGLALAMLPPSSDIRRTIPPIQHLLLTIGSHIAVPSDADEKYRNRVPKFPVDFTQDLEKAIDAWWAQLPPLTTFVLPGGTPAAAALHLARAAARRAERQVSGLTDPVDPIIRQFLNRLSDFLFAAARYANHEQSVPDVTWQKKLEQ